MLMSALFFSVVCGFPFFGSPPTTLPLPDQVGNIPTLNEMGVMCVHEGWLYSQYLTQIKTGEQALDIGCAYGRTVVDAAKRGAFVCANDLSEDQLKILEETVKSEPFHTQITYQSGDFLTGVYPSNTYDKILIASVLHFMSPSEIQAALDKIAAILKPGGKVYILTASPVPYLSTSTSFSEEYYRRKSQGDEWPGYFTNTLAYLPQLKGKIPEKCTFSDLEPLIKIVKKSGLVVLVAKYEASSYKPAEVNPYAQDFVNIIAQKPG